MESILSEDCIIWNKYRDILDYNPETIVEALKDKEITQEFYKNCEKILEKYNKFAVSISGGVDSMLLSYYCSEYARRSKKQLFLVHINYNNRKSCPEEVKFLEDWSRIIDVPFKYKEMNITRERRSKYREDYEKITKEIRFNFYKTFECPILLGHNKDDCYENIFANLSKQIHFENLFGMSPISCDYDVTIVRPFLGIYKKSIIEKAHELNIPYLEDSTPAWSVRGKMRDSLIPNINEFDCNILTGFDEYIKRTKFLESYWDKNFKIWRDSIIKNTISDNEIIYTIDKSNEFYIDNYQEISFWIKFWFTLKLKSRPSNKSLRQFIEKIKTPFIKNTAYILGKNIKVEIAESKLVINLSHC